MAEQRCCHFVDMQHKASQISSFIITPVSLHIPRPIGPFICFSHMAFFFLVFQTVHHKCSSLQNPLAKYFWLKYPRWRFRDMGDGDGGGDNNNYTLMPMHEICSHFFLQHHFPNSLGIPLLFSAAIWFSILLTGVIKLCIHSGHFSC